MMADRVRQALVVFATLAMIGVNSLANTLPLNGQTTGEISDRFEVFFVPEGYVFSIWGLIYLGLLAYTVYQARPSQAARGDLNSIGGLFVLSSLANIAWLFFWHYEIYTMTILAMLAILGLLVAIYLRLNIGRTDVSTGMKWSVHLPFSIYLGWITVATIANFTSLLSFLNWSGWGISPEVWALIMLTAAVFIGAAVSMTRGDVAFAAVLIWAFVGIAVKHGDNSTVATGAWIAAVTTTGVMLIAAYRVIGRNNFQALSPQSADYQK